MTTKYTQYPYCKPANDAAYRTNVVSHESIHSKARINWFVFASWSAIIGVYFACLAGVMALFM